MRLDPLRGANDSGVFPQPSEHELDDQLEHSRATWCSRRWRGHGAEAGYVETAVGVASQRRGSDRRRSGHDAIGGRIRVKVQRGVQAGEIGVVENVERVGAQLDPRPLFDKDLLLNGHIEVDHARNSEPVLTRIKTRAADRRSEEARTVQTVERIARPGVGFTAGNDTNTGTPCVRARDVDIACARDAEAWGE